ncbi:tetraacyldisaccharide 4'-kinase [Prevotella sp. PINT]|jgi:tetraacyldisaccharide 4''-kinase|nr:tetraacyldisaccharide 4'-kinase [Palleniella intestinalis]NPD81145.1 tetraacyldisaccharide 4'-kinase [Palleniella intestinalis]
MEGDFIKIYKALTPLSWLYGMGVRFRNMLFEMGILRSRSFTIPIISVGNITVGGAGKTPHVEYLVRLLRKRVRVAVLSRGYKRKTRGYVLAEGNMTSADIGDEPCQMYMKYGADTDKNRAYIAVDANRCEGIERLRHDKATDDTDVIILDDAYQHRYVKPGVNILLVDYHRLIVYDKLLPAGRLREPKSGKERADIVIVTKCPKDLRPMEFRVIKKAMDLRPYQKLFFTTLNYGALYPVFPEGNAMRLEDISEKHNIVALTGIASPQQLLLDLGKYTKNITPMTFSDHHRFTDKDIDKINNLFDTIPEPRIIITTEKDAARLKDIDGLSDAVRRNILALPIEIGFMLDGAEEFDEFILSYLQKNSKNSILARLKDSEKVSEKSKINFR